MKRILLTIIACTVVLSVGSFASAKDAPVIEVVKGTAKVLKENATANLTIDWSNAYRTVGTGQRLAVEEKGNLIPESGVWLQRLNHRHES